MGEDAVHYRAVPMVSYEDVGAAVDWLSRAFGFRERGVRYTDPEGRVTHAEIDLGGAEVELGWPGPEYQSPAHHAEVCEQARAWLALPYVIDGVLVQVSDVDAHHARAKSAGATILRQPQDEPYGRVYNAADLEGHRWMFLRPPATET
jgi:PhnB protein